MAKPDRAVYSPTDFLTWRETDGLSLTPKFQRRGVWKPKARSFFVDTLLRGMTIPPIYIRVTQNESATRVVREIIDGQQRISAVLDFIDGKYSLSKSLSAEWAGKSFSQLSKPEQGRLRSFGFSSEVFQDVSDQEVLELFARLNTYSVKLSKQELRNGRFFGLFKQSAYELAFEHLEFWRRNKIFTETAIARMLEAELTSELMIAAIDGMQDKKQSIDDYYDKFDDEFANRKRVEKRFRTTVDALTGVMGDTLALSEFRRSPLFYSLWCAVHHRLFGLAGVTAPTPKKPFDSKTGERFRVGVGGLSDVLAAAKAKESFPKKYTSFVAACQGQTDNIKPRQTRLDFLVTATSE
jgi:hypothetical protein